MESTVKYLSRGLTTTCGMKYSQRGAFVGRRRGVSQQRRLRKPRCRGLNARTKYLSERYPLSRSYRPTPLNGAHQELRRDDSRGNEIRLSSLWILQDRIARGSGWTSIRLPACHHIRRIGQCRSLFLEQQSHARTNGFQLAYGLRFVLNGKAVSGAGQHLTRQFRHRILALSRFT